MLLDGGRSVRESVRVCWVTWGEWWIGGWVDGWLGDEGGAGSCVSAGAWGAWPARQECFVALAMCKYLCVSLCISVYLCVNRADRFPRLLDKFNVF